MIGYRYWIQISDTDRNRDNRKGVAECHEMEKYAKIFFDVFARVSVKNFFPDIFIKYLNFS